MNPYTIEIKNKAFKKMCEIYIFVRSLGPMTNIEESKQRTKIK